MGKENLETQRSVLRQINFSKETIGKFQMWTFIFKTLSIFPPLTLRVPVAHSKDCGVRSFSEANEHIIASV